MSDRSDLTLRRREVLNLSFNYDGLESALAIDARAIANRIRARMRSSIADTGRDLIEIKHRLPHGGFCKWIHAEFQMSERSAENYMNTARFMVGKPAIVADLPPAVLYALAAPLAPEDIVAEVVTAAVAGKVADARAIKCKLAAARQVAKADMLEAAKSPEQRARERENARRRRKSDAEWQAKQKADYASRQQARETATHGALEFLLSRMRREEVAAFLKLLDGTGSYYMQQALDAPQGGE